MYNVKYSPLINTATFLSEQSGFQHFPRQQAISENDKAEVKLMLKMRANKKLIQQHIRKGTRKSVTLKDLDNMVERRHGGLTELIEKMKRILGN